MQRTKFSTSIEMDGKTMSAQKYFYEQFQRGPTFNRTFIDNLCRNLTTFQVVCELNRQAAISKVKLISRPDRVLTGYEQISEVIYHFVNTFLYMNVERYGSLKGEMDKARNIFRPGMRSSGEYKWFKNTCLLEWCAS